MQLQTNQDTLLFSNIDTSKAVRSSINATATSLTLLADDLYQNKPGAICREIISNGNDSHVRAGCKDTPVHVHVPTMEHPVLIVRDFGTGLDEAGLHRMLDLFSSDKNNTDNEIGGFGVGANSPRSYTKQYQVTSFFNGKKLHALCFDDDEGFPAHVIESITDTDEPNGVMVTIPIRQKSIKTFQRELVRQTLFFTPQPYFTNIEKQPESFWLENSREEMMFTRTKKECETYGLDADAYVIVDQVLYPLSLDRSYFDEEFGAEFVDKKEDEDDIFSWSLADKLEILADWSKFYDTKPFSPFKISEIKPSLSRESVAMNRNTVLSLKVRLESAIDKISGGVRDIIKCKNVTEIWEKFNPDEITEMLKLMSFSPRGIANFKKNRFGYDINFLSLERSLHRYIPDLVDQDNGPVLPTVTRFSNGKFVSTSLDRGVAPFNYHVVFLLNNSKSTHKTHYKEYLVNKLHKELGRVSMRQVKNMNSRDMETRGTEILMLSYGDVDTDDARRRISECIDDIPHNVVVVDVNDIIENEFCAIRFKNQKTYTDKDGNIVQKIVEPGYWCTYRITGDDYATEKKMSLSEMVDLCKGKNILFSGNRWWVDGSKSQLGGINVVGQIKRPTIMLGTSDGVAVNLKKRLSQHKMSYTEVNHTVDLSDYIDIDFEITNYLNGKKGVDDYVKYRIDERINEMKLDRLDRSDILSYVVSRHIFREDKELVSMVDRMIPVPYDEFPQHKTRIHQNVKRVIDFVFDKHLSNELNKTHHGKCVHFRSEFDRLYSEFESYIVYKKRLKTMITRLEKWYPWLQPNVLNAMMTNQHQTVCRYKFFGEDKQLVARLRHSIKKVK